MTWTRLSTIHTAGLLVAVAGPTSNEICSLPIRISNSCRPSLFFGGHLESSSLRRVSCRRTVGYVSYFMISLSLTMRLISLITAALTHTTLVSSLHTSTPKPSAAGKLTFFPDQGVIAVVGVVRVTRRCTATISEGPEVEFFACQRLCPSKIVHLKLPT